MNTLTAHTEFALPESVGATSRVWIYQSTRSLTDSEVAAIAEASSAFVKEWAAHGTSLTADFGIYFNRFICLFVDESAHGASGCSIDSSVHFIQAIERQFKLSLFTRTEVAYWNKNGELDTIHMNDISNAAKLGQMDKDTLVFNNLVATKGEMEKGWIVPISESWQGRMLD